MRAVSVSTALALYSWTGLSWIDPVAGFVIAGFAVKEGRDAWQASWSVTTTATTEPRALSHRRN